MCSACACVCRGLGGWVWGGFSLVVVGRYGRGLGVRQIAPRSRWCKNRTMDTKTHQTDIGEQLQRAVLQAALDAATPPEDIKIPTLAATDPEVNKPAENERKGAKGGVSPLTGAPTPAGRPKGVRNKLTNLRDAVIEAFDRVGGADYLVRLAEGTQSDRAAFVSLMNKVLPTQVQANVDGGIKLELSWLSARNIGTATAQTIEHKTQVIDLQQDSDGKYLIKNPGEGDKPQEK